VQLSERSAIDVADADRPVAALGNEVEIQPGAGVEQERALDRDDSALAGGAAPSDFALALALNARQNMARREPQREHDQSDQRKQQLVCHGSRLQPSVDQMCVYPP
jgi:hypothetical protein